MKWIVYIPNNQKHGFSKSNQLHCFNPHFKYNYLYKLCVEDIAEYTADYCKVGINRLKVELIRR